MRATVPVHAPVVSSDTAFHVLIAHLYRTRSSPKHHDYKPKPLPPAARSGPLCRGRAARYEGGGRPLWRRRNWMSLIRRQVSRSICYPQPDHADAHGVVCLSDCPFSLTSLMSSASRSSPYLASQGSLSAPFAPMRAQFPNHAIPPDCVPPTTSPDPWRHSISTQRMAVVSSSFHGSC